MELLDDECPFADSQGMGMTAPLWYLPVCAHARTSATCHKSQPLENAFLNRNGEQMTTATRHIGVAVAAFLLTSLNSVAQAQVLTATGDHGAVLREDGSVAAWGLDNHGEVSHAASVSDAVSIVSGGIHNLALLRDGSIMGWGSDGFGQVSGAFGVRDVVAFAAGGSHSLAVRSDGSVAAWGRDLAGQVSGAAGVQGAIAVAAGESHSMALLSDGTIVGWGWDTFGQVSDAPNVRGAVAIAAGWAHSLALLTDGTIVGWGEDGNHQVRGAAHVTNAVSIACGAFHSLALRSDGTIAAWGENGIWQATAPAGLRDGVAIAAGIYFSVALLSDGTIVHWGETAYGVGDVPTVTALPPSIWSSTSGGTFLGAHNWKNRTPSTAISDAEFAVAATYAVSFDTNARARNVRVLSGDVTFDLGDFTYAAEGNVLIAPGARLASNGILRGSVINQGTLAPGIGVGTLRIEGDFATSGTIESEIDSPLIADRLEITGNVSLGGVLAIRLGGAAPARGERIQLFKASGLIDNGFVFDFTDATLAPGLAWDTKQFITSGAIAVVPEPSSFALAVAGGVLVLGFMGTRLLAIRRMPLPTSRLAATAHPQKHK
jgi:hypothetical protein